LFVLRFNNKTVERTFVVFSLIYVTYIISAVLAHPDWHAVLHGTVVPTLRIHDVAWVTMVVGIIGTTISPYMQFFLQSQVVDKGSRAEDLTLARADVINGSLLAIALAGFMMIASAATIFVANQHGAHLYPTQAADFAVALKPLAGHLAETVFALGILNAGLFTATVLPLSTSFIVCEALGFEAAVDRRFSEAPFFFTIFGAGLIVAAAFVLLPGLPLYKMILFAQNLQGILLPPELILMLIIINRTSVMGKYTNSLTANIIAWVTAIAIGALSVLYVVLQFIPQLFSGRGAS
jgi:Mn2+/Fe2+ NRAMP family transporter